MNYIKELKDPKLAKSILQKINDCKREINIMEVCGTHTMNIFKSGIRDLIPSNINLICGPGCPVCVTPQNYIDSAMELSKNENVIIATFGDLIKVPGSKSSLQIQKSNGRDIRVVYSPLQSLDIAKENKNKEVVFLGVGFETTAPVIALSVYNAKNEGLSNFSLLHSIKTMPNAMKNLVLDDDVNIDGFLCPGNVSAVIGVRHYEFLANNYKLPMVIAGFENSDILAGIYTLIEMINNNEYEIKNTYNRLVKYEGNKKALSLINEVFEECSSTWRGLGNIENTGLKIKDKYKNYDAYYKFNINLNEINNNKECICGQILKGAKKPIDCKLFKNTCNPQNPIGPCMVSEEGTCLAYYKYCR